MRNGESKKVEYGREKERAEESDAGIVKRVRRRGKDKGRILNIKSRGDPMCMITLNIYMGGTFG